MSIADVSRTLSSSSSPSPTRSSLRRKAANQKNAEKSTGPKSVEGKARSRTNAVKHGLCAEIIEPLGLDSSEQARFAERLETWRPSYQDALKEGDSESEFLFRHLVLQTVRVEAARRRECEMIDKVRQRARTTWDDDRSLLAESIGSTLKRNPGFGVAKLRTFLQGTEWLIDRLDELKYAIQSSSPNPDTPTPSEPDPQSKTLPPPLTDEISDEQTAALLNLLGVAHAARVANRRLNRADAIRRIDECLETIDSDHLDDLEALDDVDRQRAEMGQLAEIPHEERLNRRYESQALREFFNTRDELRSLIPQAKKPNPSTDSTIDSIKKPITTTTIPTPDPTPIPIPIPSAPPSLPPSPTLTPKPTPAAAVASPQPSSTSAGISSALFEAIVRSTPSAPYYTKATPNDTPRVREMKHAITTGLVESIGSRSVGSAVAGSGLLLSKVVRNEANGILGKMCRS